ncbi:MAG: hypothetical protein EBV03_09315 [Proteobacteria bacterium]|nr:hypothetical protein [Pseudomonadota bacterium]
MIWNLLLGWWQRSYAAVLKWGAIAAAALLVLVKILQSGRDQERADQLMRQNETVSKANEVETDMRRVRDGDSLSELRRDWTRK